MSAPKRELEPLRVQALLRRQASHQLKEPRKPASSNPSIPVSRLSSDPPLTTAEKEAGTTPLVD